MNNQAKKELAYFPGCSLATSAKENNRSLHTFCSHYGVKLKELSDWNCCGSSSAHSVNPELGEYLPARNLSLVPPGNQLLVACPSCYLRLKHAQLKIGRDLRAQAEFKRMWHRPFNPDLEIINFFELLSQLADEEMFDKTEKPLNGLKVASYYGCMLNRPPEMRHERNFHGLMEKVLTSLGAEPVPWSHGGRCCGTFLSVSRPLIASRSVQSIMDGAINAGAECIVTACAMCHLNLEIRSRFPGRVPVLYFSELLSLSDGVGQGQGWFSKHLIDPRPLLKSRRLIA